jgi:putative ABC transport system substrate-binding protein
MTCGRADGDQMKRRTFITLLGGAAVAWPLAAHAQQRTGKIPRVGFLLNVQSELVVALFEGLRDAGYIDGQNMVVETRFSGTMLDRIADLANELVALNCDVIFAAGPYAIQALMRATSTIPIVAIDLESDPIANGWASSIGRPGGNLTGPSSDPVGSSLSSISRPPGHLVLTSLGFSSSAPTR